MTVRDLWNVCSDGKLCVRADSGIYGVSDVNGVMTVSDFAGNTLNVSGWIVVDIRVTAVAGYGMVMLATVY